MTGQALDQLEKLLQAETFEALEKTYGQAAQAARRYGANDAAFILAGLADACIDIQKALKVADVARPANPFAMAKAINDALKARCGNAGEGSTMTRP